MTQELEETIKEILAMAATYKSTQNHNEKAVLELYGIALGLSNCTPPVSAAEGHEFKGLARAETKASIESTILKSIYDFLLKLPKISDSVAKLGQCINTSRMQLKSIRSQFQAATIADRLELRKSFIKFIQNIFNYIKEVLGEPTCRFSIVGLGSLATGMVTPYSDLEYIILLDTPAKSFEGIDTYTRNFCDLFDLIMIGFGESPIHEAENLLFAKLNINFQHSRIQAYLNKFKTGIRVDAHKRPQVINRKIGLRSNPLELLLKLPYEIIHQHGNHLTSALLTTTLLWGNVSLYQSYQSLFEQLLVTREYANCLSRLLRADLEACKEVSEKFDKISSHLNRTTEDFSIKQLFSFCQHLARQLLIYLRIYHPRIRLKSDLFEILQELHVKGFVDNLSYTQWKNLSEKLFLARLTLQKERGSANSNISFNELQKIVQIKQLQEGLHGIVQIVSTLLSQHDLKVNSLYHLKHIRTWIDFKHWSSQHLGMILTGTCTIFLSFSWAYWYDPWTIEDERSKILNNDALISHLKLYIAGRGVSSQTNSTSFNLTQAVIDFLNDEKTQILLLLADSGGGKTLFTEYLNYRLWQSGEITRMPYLSLRVDLAGVHNLSNIVSESLNWIPRRKIQHLKENYHFLWILDGYDRIAGKQNLYQINAFREYRSKVIITCRREYLLNLGINYKSLFYPDSQPGRPQTLQEIHVTPFRPQDIKDYIHQYINHYQLTSPWNNTQHYLDQINRFQNLDTLSENPLLLNILLQVLPRLAERYQQALPVPLLTRSDLYQEFLNSWFQREIDRTNEAIVSVVFDKPPIIELKSYGQCIAIVMYRRDTKTISLQDPTWNECLSIGKNPKPIRDMLPLKESSGVYAFIHDSFGEYLVASDTLETLARNISDSHFSEHPLNQKYFNADVAIIKFIAEGLARDVRLQSCAWHIIESSRYASVIVASANSATFLNAARIPFSYRNLTAVRIPGADLSYNVLEGTIAKEADLRNSTIHGSWLRNLDARNALMQGVSFGKGPYFEFDQGLARFMWFSPKGKWLAVTTYGINQDKIYLFETKTASLKSVFIGHSGWIGSVAFSPNETMMASGSMDASVILWDIKAESYVWYKNLTEYVDSVAFTVQNSNLIIKSVSSDGKDGKIYIWKASNGVLLDTIFLEDFYSVGHGLFSLDGTRLTQVQDKILPIWDATNGKLLQRIPTEGDPFFSSLAFSQDGKIIASGSCDNKKAVHLWMADNGESLGTLIGHDSPVFCVAINQKRGMVVSGDIRGNLYLWEMASHSIIYKIKVHQSIISVAFSPNGKHLATGGMMENTIHFWEISKQEELKITGQLSLIQKEDLQEVSVVRISPLGDLVASGSQDGLIRLWETRTGKLTHILKHTDMITDIKFSHDGRKIGSRTFNYAAVSLWDTKTGKRIFVLEHWGVGSFAFNPTMEIMATGGKYNNSIVHIWDLRTGSPFLKPLITNSHEIISVIFTKDGNKVIASCPDSVYVWDVATGEKIKEYKTETDHYCCPLIISSDGDIMEVEKRDNESYYRDLEKETTLVVHNNCDHPLHINGISDGDIIYSRENRTICPIDIKSGNHPFVIKNVDYGIIEDVSFFHDWEFLFLATRHKESVRLYQIPVADALGKVIDFKKFQLLWGSEQNILVLSGINVEGARLSTLNAALLKQQGAIGHPVVEEEEGSDVVDELATIPSLETFLDSATSSSIESDFEPEKYKQEILPSVSSATRTKPWTASIKSAIDFSFVELNLIWKEVVTHVSDKLEFASTSSSLPLRAQYQETLESSHTIYNGSQVDERRVLIHSKAKIPDTTRDKTQVPFESTFLRELSTFEYLTVILPWIIYQFRKYSFFTFPWNRVRPLKDEDKQMLLDLQCQIKKMEKTFKFQRNSCAANTGLFDDKIKFISTNLKSLNEEVNQALKQNKISNTTYNHIVTRTDKVRELMKQLAKDNRTVKKLERTAILKIERALRPKDHEVLERTATHVQYDFINQTLALELLNIQEKHTLELQGLSSPERSITNEDNPLFFSHIEGDITKNWVDALSNEVSQKLTLSRFSRRR